MDQDKAKVGRAFSNRVIEMVLASYPGLLHDLAARRRLSFGVYWPALVPDDVPHHQVVIGDERIRIEPVPAGDRVPVDRGDEAHWPEALAALRSARSRRATPRPRPRSAGSSVHARATRAATPTSACGPARTTRSSGSTAYLTVERLRELMPAETDGLDVDRHELPNLRALNFVLVGAAWVAGVAASTRIDPQAKGLGEYLRAKVVDLPSRLLATSPTGSGAAP